MQRYHGNRLLIVGVARGGVESIKRSCNRARFSRRDDIVGNTSNKFWRFTSGLHLHLVFFAGVIPI